MASKLGSVLDGMTAPGMSRLRVSTGMNVRAAQTYEDPSYQRKSALIGTVGKLAEMGADAYMKYDAVQKQKADERSNEIIRSLTPQQRREAIKNGTLLYQDDEYAMQSLKEKTGRNAAFLIDDEVQQAIQEGRFRSRTEMEEFRHSRMQEASKKYADEFGIDFGDEHYQRGLNSNITDRNIALYGSHDKFLSDQFQKGSVVNAKVELGSALTDPDVLRSKNAGEFFQGYIDNGLVTGSIPSDDQAYQLITSSLNDVIQRPGGADFLQSIQDRKVTLNGTTSTYKELMGDEMWNNMMVKAQASQFQNDAKLNETFRLNVSSALNQADTATGWEQLQTIKAELDKRQPGEEMTPERERLIAAQEHMQARINQESASVAKEMDKQQKSLNKYDVIDAQFNKRLSGDYVSTSYKDMPTNENTGEFTHSDMVNFANKKLAQIEAMELTDEQKDKLKLDYLRADSKEGAFRTAVGELVTDAGQEWSAAVINGKMPENTAAMDSLRRLRNTDPNLVAALYPDQADLFLTMDMMDKQGIDPQVLIDADRARRNQTKEMQFEDDKAWASLKNNSQSPELSRIPASLDGMARKIYDSVKYRSGNSDMAMQQVDKFLKESTTTFTVDDVDGDTIGVVPKNILQVTDDPRSWEQGKDILDKARQGIIAANPWVTNKQLSVYQQGDSIYLMDTTGQIRIRYDRELLAREYQATAAKQAEAAKEKALKEAQKRAPITQATKARAEAGKRVRAKQKATPKYIYGGKPNE